MSLRFLQGINAASQVRIHSRISVGDSQKHLGLDKMRLYTQNPVVLKESGIDVERALLLYLGLRVHFCSCLLICK